MLACVRPVQGGFASDVGEQSLVAALSANGPALHQLVALLEQCGKVQAAAAGEQEKKDGNQVHTCIHCTDTNSCAL